MKALGLIEVIGFVPAVEAADSALKAANIKLIDIAKADGGIMTVEVTGDVGAVTAAVDAGAAAASKIGELRASHVIPRVEETLIGKVIYDKKEKKSENDKVKLIEDKSAKPLDPFIEKINELEKEMIKDIEPLNSITPEEDSNLSESELVKKSNTALKNIILKESMGKTEEELKTARKQDLVNIILEFQKSKNKGES